MVFKEAKRSADTLHTCARALHTFASYLVKLKLLRGDFLTEFDIPERAAVGRKNWLKSQEMQRVIAESKDSSLTSYSFADHSGIGALHLWSFGLEYRSSPSPIS